MYCGKIRQYDLIALLNFSMRKFVDQNLFRLDPNLIDSVATGCTEMLSIKK